MYNIRTDLGRGKRSHNLYSAERLPYTAHMTYAVGWGLANRIMPSIGMVALLSNITQAFTRATCSKGLHLSSPHGLYQRRVLAPDQLVMGFRAIGFKRP